MTQRGRVATRQRALTPSSLTPSSIDAISAFSHRSARLVLALCKSEARYARLRDLVEQELGAYAARHLDELRRMVSA